MSAVRSDALADEAFWSLVGAELARQPARVLRRAMPDWSRCARAAQLPPPGDWRQWLLIGGRGSGKTRAGAEWIRARGSGHRMETTQE